MLTQKSVFFCQNKHGRNSRSDKKSEKYFRWITNYRKTSEEVRSKAENSDESYLREELFAIKWRWTSEKSEQKIKSLTEIAVSHSTRQRLVHRYAFEELPSNPEVEVEEMSIDGGKVRLRTPKGVAQESPHF
jgi:hypothetical protein